MKKYFLFYFSIPIICLFSCNNEKPIDISLSELKWLCGEWKIDNGDSTITYEKWTQENENSINGIGMTIDDKGDTTFFEEMKILKQDGKITMNISVDRTDVVPFLLIKYANQEAAFENPEHDFPQKITYFSKNDSTLFAIIGGEVYDGKKNMKFEFKRMK